MISSINKPGQTDSLEAGLQGPADNRKPPSGPRTNAERAGNNADKTKKTFMKGKIAQAKEKQGPSDGAHATMDASLKASS